MGGGVQRARERGRERGALLIGEAAETLSSCRFLSKNKIKKNTKLFVCLRLQSKISFISHWRRWLLAQTWICGSSHLFHWTMRGLEEGFITHTPTIIFGKCPFVLALQSPASSHSPPNTTETPHITNYNKNCAHQR